MIRTATIIVTLLLYVLNNAFSSMKETCFDSSEFLSVIIATATIAGALTYFVYFQSFIEERLYRIMFRIVVAESAVAALAYTAFFSDRFLRLLLFIGSLAWFGLILYHVVEYVVKYRRIAHGMEISSPSLYFRITSSLISLLLMIYIITRCIDFILCIPMIILGVFIIVASFNAKIMIKYFHIIVWFTPIVFFYVFLMILLGSTNKSLLLFIPVFLGISILSRTFYYTTYHYSSLKTLICRPIVVIDIKKFKPHKLHNVLSMVLSRFIDYEKIVFISGYAPVFMPIVIDVMNKMGFSEKISIYVTRVEAAPFFKFRFRKYVMKKFRINETILPEDKSKIYTSINYLVRAEKKTLVFIDDFVELTNILGSELVYNIIRSLLQKSDFGEKIGFVIFVRTELLDLFKEEVRKLYNEIKSSATTVFKV